MKAVIYARVSTASQSDGTSLQSQVEACEKYAKENKLRVVDVFREVGSGSTLVDRQQLDIIRRSVRSGSYTHLIAYAVDRLSRSISHLFILLDECDRFGVDVLFATETLDSSPEGKLLQSVKGYVAEVEREKIRERCMRGRKQNAINGTLKYRRKLYGYELDGDWRRVLCESEAVWVRSIYHDIQGGNSLRSVAARLNREGVPTPYGNDMSKPLYEDVKKKEIRRCVVCSSEIASLTVGNFCSKTCWLARQQKTKIVRRQLTR